MEKRIFYSQDVNLGDEIASLTRTITQEEVRAFMVTMGYLHPRFYDDKQAKKEGHGGVVLPGPLSTTLLCQMLTRRFSFSALKKISVDVKGTVRPDEPLICGGMIINKYVENRENLVECDLYIQNEAGERPVKGRAVIRLDEAPS
jgi:hypothetical protein